eukprot:g1535.t1
MSGIYYCCGDTIQIYEFKRKLTFSASYVYHATASVEKINTILVYQKTSNMPRLAPFRIAMYIRIIPLFLFGLACDLYCMCNMGVAFIDRLNVV